MLQYKTPCTAEVLQIEISNVTAIILVQLLMLLRKKISGYRMGAGILMMILNTTSHLSLTGQTDYGQQMGQQARPNSVTSLSVALQNVSILLGWASGLCPSSRILNTTEQHFGNWIGFHPQARGGRRLLCWVPCKELISITSTQQRRCLHPLTWGRKQIQSPKRCVF
jgi:hypothetical protein